MSKNWVELMERPTFGANSYISMEGFFLGFFKEAVQSLKPVHSIHMTGTLVAEVDEVIAGLEELGFVALVKKHTPIKRKKKQATGTGFLGRRARRSDEDPTPMFFMREQCGTLAYFYPTATTDGASVFQGYTLDDDIKDKLLGFLEGKLIEEQHGDGKVWSLSASPGGGLETRLLGVAGKPLERGNYTDEVLSSFDRAIHDLMSPDPLGRLVIIEGKPGTGKTFLVRGLIYEARELKHYLLPPNMVQQLGTPEFIPLLLEMAQQKEDGPAVFILEDADQCLVPRGADNMSAISSMLNLTDGILGRLVDIRLVLTTNASKVDMDQALLRTGRISSFMTVNELTADRANEVYHRLADKNREEPYVKPTILADVYYHATNKPAEMESLVPVPAQAKKDRRVGFG